MSNKKVNQVDELENVEHALSASELFIEKNQKNILYVVAAIAAIVVIVLAVKNFYIKPREVQAANEMAKSQTYFARDSFQIALNGDALESMGFLEIEDQYGWTASGNLAAAYAGICYFELGKYEDAIDQLSKYDGDDAYFSVAVVGLQGDCYAETGDVEKAVKFFEKAASSSNKVLSPIYHKKAGIAYEKLGDAKNAAKHYLIIKDDYSMDPEASDIDKYLARVQG